MTKLHIIVFFVCLIGCICFRFSTNDPWIQVSGCENFDNQNACSGKQTDNDDSWASRSFQTPPRNHSLWRESYQDYNILVGYPRVVYSSDKKSAKI